MIGDILECLSGKGKSVPQKRPQARGPICFFGSRGRTNRLRIRPSLRTSWRGFALFPGDSLPRSSERSIWKFDSWTIHSVLGELLFLRDRKGVDPFPADRWIIGYANDHPGYLMPEEDGSYESMTLYNPEEIRRLIDELRESI